MPNSDAVCQTVDTAGPDLFQEFLNELDEVKELMTDSSYIEITQKLSLLRQACKKMYLLEYEYFTPVWVSCQCDHVEGFVSMESCLKRVVMPLNSDLTGWLCSMVNKSFPAMQWNKFAEDYSELVTLDHVFPVSVQDKVRGSSLSALSEDGSTFLIRPLVFVRKLKAMNL